MKLTKLLPAIIAPLISLAPNLTAIADAQSIVRGRCYVSVTGLEQGSRVNMRSAPGVDSEIVGYVLVGQEVNLLRYEAGATVRESDGEAGLWNYVEYVPSRTRGWIATPYLGKRCLESP
jgi:uncharacterized protein YraI